MKRTVNAYRWFKRRPWLHKENKSTEEFLMVLERHESGNIEGMRFLWDKKRNRWIVNQGYQRVGVKADNLNRWGPIKRPSWSEGIEAYIDPQPNRQNV